MGTGNKGTCGCNPKQRDRTVSTGSGNDPAGAAHDPDYDEPIKRRREAWYPSPYYAIAVASEVRGGSSKDTDGQSSVNSEVMAQQFANLHLTDAAVAELVADLDGQRASPLDLQLLSRLPACRARIERLTPSPQTTALIAVMDRQREP